MMDKHRRRQAVRPGWRSSFGLTVLGVAAIVPLLLALLSSQVGGWLPLGWLLLINLVAYFSYRSDKRLARYNEQHIDRQRTRVSEHGLLRLIALGGTIGALLGRRHFRHKTTKRSFQLKLWPTLIVQALSVAGVLFFWW